MDPKQSIPKKSLAWLLILSLLFTFFLPESASMDVQAAQKITLSKRKLTMYSGTSQTITVNNANGTVKWSSNKKKVASVNSTGTIKARKPGKAVINLSQLYRKRERLPQRN